MGHGVIIKNNKFYVIFDTKSKQYYDGFSRKLIKKGMWLCSGKNKKTGYYKVFEFIGKTFCPSNFVSGEYWGGGVYTVDLPDIYTLDDWWQQNVLNKGL